MENLQDMDEDEKDNYSVLINSLKNMVESTKEEDKEVPEDENFAEEEKDRVYPKYTPQLQV